MRRAMKDKLSSVFDESYVPNIRQELDNSVNEGYAATESVMEFIKQKSDSLITTVQEHVTSVTDTTGALAKQKLLQRLLASGVIQSECIRQTLQIGMYTPFVYFFSKM